MPALRCGAPCGYGYRFCLWVGALVGSERRLAGRLPRPLGRRCGSDYRFLGAVPSCLADEAAGVGWWLGNMPLLPFAPHASFPDHAGSGTLVHGVGVPPSPDGPATLVLGTGGTAACCCLVWVLPCADFPRIFLRRKGRLLLSMMLGVPPSPGGSATLVHGTGRHGGCGGGARTRHLWADPVCAL